MLPKTQGEKGEAMIAREIENIPKEKSGRSSESIWKKSKKGTGTLDFSEKGGTEYGDQCNPCG